MPHSRKEYRTYIIDRYEKLHMTFAGIKITYFDIVLDGYQGDLPRLLLRNHR